MTAMAIPALAPALSPLSFLAASLAESIAAAWNLAWDCSVVGFSANVIPLPQSPACFE